MRFYVFLDRFCPGSYPAKFTCVLLLALGVPVAAGFMVPAGSPAGMTVLVSGTLIAGILGQRAIRALLDPLARVSEALLRIEAGYRVRPLPDLHRDELGLLMECTNRLAIHMERQLSIAVQEAERDALTGLLNRRGLERRIPGTRPGAFLMIDLDHFKTINDAHGHAVGDRVLSQAASLLSATFRHGDLLARVGGEEFLACLPGASLDQARQAAERVRIAFEDGLAVGGAAVTASIGVACGHRGVASSQVIGAADRAAFRAKSAGRNRVVCANSVPADAGMPNGESGRLAPQGSGA